MNILITGVSGFSGSYLAEFLSKKYKVFGIFRNEKSLFLKKIIKNKRINFIKTDICNIEQSKLKGLKSIDFVIHVGSTSPSSEIKTFELVYDNLFGIQNLINWSIKKKCKKFIFFSSMSAFGEILDEVVDERTKSISPDVYGQTKIISEKILSEVSNKFENISLRLPGIVGPDSRRNWISVLRNKLLSNNKIQIYNKEAKFNNLIHIKDLSFFVENLFSKSFKHNFLLVGSNDQLKIFDIVKILKQLTNSKSEIEFVSETKKSFLIDSNLAKKKYGLETMNLHSSLSLIY